MNQPDDKWLEWQRDHAAALTALQEAQRAYHRTVVGRAFTISGDSPAAGTRQGPLDDLEAARIKLDEVRARQPG